MRSYHHIDLGAQSVRTETLEGEDIVRAGRYLIAKTLNEENIAKVDPLSPENPLIFSAGPFAGTNFSNANRCLLYTSPSPRDKRQSRMPSSA